MYKKKKIWVLVGGIFFSATAITFLYFLSLLSSSSSPSSTPLLLSSSSQPGSLNLNSGSRTIFVPGDDIYITVSANSKSIPISGFDAVISYDPSKLMFVKAENGLADFDLFTSTKTNQVTLTAGLKLNDTKPMPLQDSVLATVHFKAKKEGKATFSLIFTPGGKTDSNLLSDKTEDILGRVIGEDVWIGRKVTLFLNQPSTLNNKKFTLLESTVPAAQCKDCQSIVRISVEENGQTQIIQFLNGGIDGHVERQKAVGNMQFELEDATSRSIILNVSN